MLRNYYHLTKPGIIYGNAITAIAGFFLAQKGYFHPVLFLATLLGLSLVIASGCVFNNIYDRSIDAKMQRTKNRAMVSGKISQKNANVFGILLLVVAILVLHLFSSPLSLLVSLAGFIVYVFLYTPLKSRTVYATLVGSIAGAVPPVVGYVAITNHLDAAAWLLFFILVFWQMPHFYAIAIRRLEDYKAAAIPVLPFKKGITETKIHMLVYIVAFIVVATLLTVYGFAGYLYLVVVLILGLTWLVMGVKGMNGLKGSDTEKWAKKMFLFSLIVLTSLCVIIPIDKLIK